MPEDMVLFPHEVKLTPKENYFRMLDGLEYEWMPCFMNTGMGMFEEDFLTPRIAPDGPIVTSLGVTYVGAPDMNFGATPDPTKHVVDDICNWRDCVHTPDLSDFDFEQYYKDKTAHIDRETQFIGVGGADYFLTLVALMGFENTFIALEEEEDEVFALLDYIHEFYMFIYKKQLQYLNPEFLSTMDDDSMPRGPFFSLETWRKFFKPYKKRHYDIALDRGMHIGHHDCGKCEMFIPDWIELGVQTWNPAQPYNDLVGIKKAHPNFTIEGGWDNIKWENCNDLEALREAVIEYIDTLAPGGHFGFFAMGGGQPGTPEWKARNDVVMDVYLNYGFDWYKNH